MPLRRVRAHFIDGERGGAQTGLPTVTQLTSGRARMHTETLCPTTRPDWLVSSGAEPRAHQAVALLPVPCPEFSRQPVFILRHFIVLGAFLSCLKTDCNLVTGSVVKFFI